MLNFNVQKESINESKLYIQEAIVLQERGQNAKIDFITKELTILKGQLDHMKDMRRTIVEIGQQLDEKASYQNLRNLEFQLGEYAKVQNFQQFIDKLSNKVEYEDFVKLQDNLTIL